MFLLIFQEVSRLLLKIVAVHQSHYRHRYRQDPSHRAFYTFTNYIGKMLRY